MAVTNLVTGATGNVGGEVVRALLAGGERVRGLVRSSDAALPSGAERALGDLDRPESLRSALVEVGAVFLLPGYRDMPGLLAELRRGGVERVVLLSGGSAGDGDMTNAISAYMIRSERAVQESGIDWTILRPSAFMSNALRWAGQLRTGDVVRAPFADVKTAVIDPADIAAVAALAMTSDRHHGRTHRLTGPQALLPAEQIRILGGVLGREIRLAPQSNAEARAEMRARMPAQYVEAFFRFYVDGELDESPVLPTVREMTGRAPRTFEQWARAHADAFA